MAKEPQVSVLMSCYNASPYLAEAVESILVQSFDDLEFITIDDGSSDDTPEILSDYARADDRIVLIEKENTGLSNSLNVGLRAARGKWIARMDADDVSLPDRLRNQLRFVTTHEGTVLLGTACIMIDHSGREISRYRYPAGHRHLIRNLSRALPPFPHASAIFLKEPVLQIGGYREKLNGSEDRDLWLRLSHLGRIYCMKAPLLKLRKHPGSITAKDRMLVLGYASTISYLLRAKGYPDPIEEDSAHCRFFLEWLDERLVQERVAEIAIAGSILSQNWRERNEASGIHRALITARGMLSSPLGCRAVRDRILGSGLPERLAKEWIMKISRISP